jgi:uncharacterized protein YciI
MQKAHLENFKRLAGEGQLLTAGPLNDPQKQLRGIVVVRAADEQQLKKMFAPDPYIESGYLTVKAIPMRIVHGQIKTKLTPAGLEEFRIVALERKLPGTSERRSKPNEDLEPGPIDLLGDLGKDERLRLAIDFRSPDSEWQGVLIFSSAVSDETILEKCSAIKQVKDGDLRVHIMPLFMGKGTLDDEG